MPFNPTDVFLSSQPPFNPYLNQGCLIYTQPGWVSGLISGWQLSTQTLAVPVDPANPFWLALDISDLSIPSDPGYLPIGSWCIPQIQLIFSLAGKPIFQTNAFIEGCVNWSSGNGQWVMYGTLLGHDFIGGISSNPQPTLSVPAQAGMVFRLAVPGFTGNGGQEPYRSISAKQDIAFCYSGIDYDTSGNPPYLQSPPTIRPARQFNFSCDTVTMNVCYAVYRTSAAYVGGTPFGFGLAALLV